MSTAETELAQALDQAYAAYKRAVGRPQALARLQFMLQRDAEAQRILETSKEVLGGTAPRAAE